MNKKLVTHWGIRIRVTCPLTGKVSLEWGRPSNSVPYSYLIREQAETAAQLWGDAYTRGDVWVEELK